MFSEWHEIAYPQVFIHCSLVEVIVTKDSITITLEDIAELAENRIKFLRHLFKVSIEGNVITLRD